MATVEVAELDEDEQFIIGLDLFPKLGFELRGVPFSFPKRENQEREEEEDVEDYSDIEDQIPEEWKQVLKDNEKLPEGNICKIKGSELAINTGDAKPVWRRQYAIPQALHKKVDERIQEWLKNGWITEAPANCQWNSPPLAVPKQPKVEGAPMNVRVCLDARGLNDVILDMPDSQMPSLREVVDSLGRFEYITVLDAANCYHQFRLRKEDQPKTAFTWNGRQYMFQVVPFGLKIMTGHLQRIMENLLECEGVKPFQDNVAVASVSKEEHIKDIKQILEKLTYCGNQAPTQKMPFLSTRGANSWKRSFERIDSNGPEKSGSNSELAKTKGCQGDATFYGCSELSS
jgi:hypothetical protein